MKTVYAIYEKDKLLFISDDKSLAEEMILSLTEEFIYHAFLKEIQRDFELGLWVFRCARKYGWNRFNIREIKMINE
jgi:hypothetical protein